jgi:hypothetical protein
MIFDRLRKLPEKKIVLTIGCERSFQACNWIGGTLFPRRFVSRSHPSAGLESSPVGFSESGLLVAG